MSNASKVYANNQIETDVLVLSPEGLILLVYERIFENLRFGKKEFEIGKYGIPFFNKASDLINYGLLSSLDHQKGGLIASNLELIYKWALQEIIIARVQKSPQKVDEIIDTLKPLYEAWQLLSLNHRNKKKEP